jgi:Lipid A 3-O-deacylase (PagL)
MRLKYAVVLSIMFACFASASVAAEPANGTTQEQSTESSAKKSAQSFSDTTARRRAPADFNRKVFFRNKLELSLETGGLPLNTPLLLGPLIGDNFSREKGLPDYTLIPTSLMLRWQLYDPHGPSFLRGTTEFSFGGVYAAIVQGPESMFVGPLIGLRYYFVQPGAKVVPYVDLRGGLGYTDAAGPWEVAHHQPDVGQGQDFTFTFSMGAGLRYDFNSRYSVSLALSYMHLSNMYLSEPKYYNHGVNTLGGLVGFNVGLNDLFKRARE